MPTYMNTLGCPLNLVGWQGFQVNAHAKALVGTVNTASLNLATVQGGPIGFAYDFVWLISLEEAPIWNKVRIHLYLLFGGITVVFLAYLRGKHYSIICFIFSPYFQLYSILMPFPSVLRGKYLFKPSPTKIMLFKWN